MKTRFVGFHLRPEPEAEKLNIQVLAGSLKTRDEEDGSSGSIIIGGASPPKEGGKKLITDSRQVFQRPTTGLN
jgi:hypothetical protein